MSDDLGNPETTTPAARPQPVPVPVTDASAAPPAPAYDRLEVYGWSREDMRELMNRKVRRRVGMFDILGGKFG